MEETTNTKTKKLMAAIIIALLLAIGGVTAALTVTGKGGQPQQVQSQATQEDAAGQKDGTSLTFTAQAGKTVLEQLQKRADVEVQESDYGPFVESINGVSGGGKYWVFYVNGQMAQVGAGEYKTNGGEKIEWKFE